ncbi:hypothetical protein PGAL8A_00330100 [Plasmodium gallinaceum]|uniref:Plasmodium RESA N-terminal domain-containing protein n=1 Tax=Plasmodium gallinaceum TaxID=5849 RepID=A0A1J1GXR4_PLAGA|nr:hypothetical protein PGAL8A_00330100 [Plasmodium gallinaceum]CRG96088.1 hypothetical protein PGAL8A_00330100 [Plasmodium gallinaceum]
MKIYKIFYILNVIFYNLLAIHLGEGAEAEQNPGKICLNKKKNIYIYKINYYNIIKILNYNCRFIKSNVDDINEMPPQLITENFALNYFNDSLKDPFEEVILANDIVLKHIFRTYSNYSNEEKKAMLLDYTGLSRFVKYFLGACIDVTTEKHEIFLAHKIMYELKKKYTEESDEINPSERINITKCFWENERFERTCSIFWYKMMIEIKNIFKSNKFFCSLSPKDQSNIWIQWYNNMKDEWLEKQTSHLKMVMEKFDKGESCEGFENFMRCSEYILNSCTYLYRSLSVNYLESIVKESLEKKGEKEKIDELELESESASGSISLSSESRLDTEEDTSRRSHLRLGLESTMESELENVSTEENENETD